MPYADAESVVRSWLADYLGAGVRVVTELPADLADQVPVVQVSRFGGSATSPVLDVPNLDVDSFDGPHDGLTARENASALALRVQAGLLFKFPGTTVGSAYVGPVTEISGPRWVPYDNTTLRRFVASYRPTIGSIPIEGVPA